MGLSRTFVFARLTTASSCTLLTHGVTVIKQATRVDHRKQLVSSPALSPQLLNFYPTALP